MKFVGSEDTRAPHRRARDQTHEREWHRLSGPARERRRRNPGGWADSEVGRYLRAHGLDVHAPSGRPSHSPQSEQQIGFTQRRIYLMLALVAAVDLLYRHSHCKCCARAGTGCSHRWRCTCRRRRSGPRRFMRSLRGSTIQGLGSGWSVVAHRPGRARLCERPSAHQQMVTKRAGSIANK